MKKQPLFSKTIVDRYLVNRPRSEQVGLACPRHALSSISCYSWCLATRMHSNFRPTHPYFLGYRPTEAVAQLRLQLLAELCRSTPSWAATLDSCISLSAVTDLPLLVLQSEWVEASSLWSSVLRFQTVSSPAHHQLCKFMLKINPLFSWNLEPALLSRLKPN